MKIIKKFDKGEEVKKLQKLLGINDDGIFGPITEECVKQFQRTHNLEVDGIVGPKTWAALGVINTNSKCVDPNVIYNPLTSCITKKPNRTIKYIAIHYTAGGSSKPGTAKTMKNTWEKYKKGSADFGVDDRDMIQFNPDINNYYCWGVGDKKKTAGGGAQLYGNATNANTISIEICSTLRPGYDASKPNHAGWYFTDKALENAIRLTKILMKKYNIPIERVVRHYDISGKICPGIIGWNNYVIYEKDGSSIKNNSSEWEKFKKSLKD